MSWKWKIEIRRHDHNTIFRKEPQREDRDIWTAIAPGKIARDYESESAYEIEAAFHYNGSGGKAFNGAKKWPHVRLEVSFQEGQIKERDAFIEKLKKFLEENL